MFPGPNAIIYRNEAGEPLGWDYPPDEPYEEDFEDAERRYAAEVCEVCGNHPEDCDRCPACEEHLTEEEGYECVNPACPSNQEA